MIWSGSLFSKTILIGSGSLFSKTIVIGSGSILGGPSASLHVPKYIYWTKSSAYLWNQTKISKANDLIDVILMPNILLMYLLENQTELDIKQT